MQSFLVCPTCRSNLEYKTGGLCCSSCAATYPVSEGIPDLAVFNDTDKFSVQSPTGSKYQQGFVEEAVSGRYDRSFKDKARKKQRTQRELHILKTQLSSFGPIDSLLNVPGGGGRLSKPLADACSLLVEADISMAQVQFARVHGAHAALDHVAWLTASAFHAPFSDKSFDGVVCARLTHHFSAIADHERLFAELCRIAKEFVIVSFADRFSTKSLSRRIRGKSNLFTLSCGQIQTISKPLGYELKDVQTVSPVGSRHRYALLVRNESV